MEVEDRILLRDKELHLNAKDLRLRIKAVQKFKDEGNALFKSNKWQGAIDKYGEALDVIAKKEEEGLGGQIRATLLSNRATSFVKVRKKLLRLYIGLVY